LTATAKKNDMRLLATVMGEESVTTRTSEATALLDYGYANYKLDQVLSKDTVIDTVKIDKAVDKTVDIIPLESVTVLNKKTETLGEISYSLSMDKITIPIKSGEKVGTLVIKEDGKKIQKVDVTVSKDLEKISFLGLFERYITDIFSGNISF
jgi:D-alanyl-D-alanine carboxypeptidase (penicillin-binding protein 5/6)